MKKAVLNLEILRRAVEEVIERKHLEDRLRSGKKLRVKFGIDPTAPDLHFGHTVPLRKLRAFQELGHNAVLIIGDFTATVGDPSGQSEVRRPLSEKEVRRNMQTYLCQASKILDLKQTEVRYNSEWYKKAGIAFFYDLMSKVTLQRVIERDDFQKRIRAEKNISMLEVMYPILQGYDSVAVRADVEIGGKDQKFNLLMGRRIQRRFGMEEQDILTTWLIEGTDGVRKMSKSYGNYIGIEEPPDQMFGKLMSIPDYLIIKYFIALTDVPLDEIEKIEREVRLKRFNPRDAKLQLAQTLVSMYHSPKAARSARDNFLRVFSRRELPKDIPNVKISYGKYGPIELLLSLQFVKSRGEARRLILQGAVDVDGKRIKNPNEQIELSRGTILKIGKRRFAQIA